MPEQRKAKHPNSGHEQGRNDRGGRQHQGQGKEGDKRDAVSRSQPQPRQQDDGRKRDREQTSHDAGDEFDERQEKNRSYPDE